MRKWFQLCTAVILLLLITVQAAAQTPSFQFQLSADGKESIEAQKGDVITLVLVLKQTASNDYYTMYAMQDEISYDSSFFELVPNSASLRSGVQSEDVTTATRFHRYYMNFLSVSGGEQWESEAKIGSIQLRVVADSGVTQITSENYLVSLQDGSGSYPCSANSVRVILSTECVVKFNSRGGSSIKDVVVQYGETLTKPKDPTRTNYTFAGWYKDLDLTEKWDFEKDTVQGNLTLYAKWNAKADPSSAQTGDNIQYVFYTAGVVAVLLTAAVMVYRKKRK